MREPQAPKLGCVGFLLVLGLSYAALTGIGLGDSAASGASLVVAIAAVGGLQFWFGWRQARPPAGYVRCPWCAEPVRREALVCPHCRRGIARPHARP